jgi:hypothetical protein
MKMDFFIPLGSFMIALAAIKAKEGKRALSYLLGFATFVFVSYRIMVSSMPIDDIAVRVLLNALLCSGLVFAGQWLSRRIQN